MVQQANWRPRISASENSVEAVALRFCVRSFGLAAGHLAGFALYSGTKIFRPVHADAARWMAHFRRGASSRRLDSGGIYDSVAVLVLADAQ